MARRVELTFAEDEYGVIEAARGEVPRATWIKGRALEAALVVPAGLTEATTVDADANGSGRAARELPKAPRSADERLQAERDYRDRRQRR